jgi:DNA invertase Pin-like site-specific DNA recombinase
VTRLDRLVRSLAHLSALDALLKQKEVMLQVLDQAIDTTTSHGQMLFGMLAVFAAFENDLRKERQMDGIRKAQARGVYIGGCPTLTPAQVLALRAQRAAGAQIKDRMRQYGLSKASVYRHLGGIQPQDAPTMVEAADEALQPQPLEHLRTPHSCQYTTCVVTHSASRQNSVE